MLKLLRRSGSLAVFLSAILVGAVVGGIAVAQTSTSPPIEACVHRETGAVRIVGSTADCRPQETPISWNAEGPAGPAGPAGPQGPAGSGLSSFDELEGMPCNVGNAGEGVIDISYAAASGGTVSMSCTPTTLHTLTVVKAGTGTGTVGSNPAGISCGTDCVQEFESGRQVTLTATPDGGNAFTGWTGACTGSASTCTLTMDAAKDVTATFQRTGELLVSISSERSSAFEPRGTGRVTGPGNFSCTASGTTEVVRCSIRYLLGSPVTLMAVPGSGSSFAWGGACSGVGSATCTVTMTEFTQVTVTFTG